MKARNLLLVVSVILVGLLVWAGFGGGPGAPAAAAPGPSQPAPAPAPAAANGAEPAAQSATGPRTALATPGRESLRVRVFDPERHPVAGAKIEVTGDDDQLEFPPTDSDGWSQAARLPLGNVSLGVRRDGCTGFASWNWSAIVFSEVTIWLERGRDVEVAVTDRSGAVRPYVDVFLFAAEATEWWQSSTRAQTGIDGVARFQLAGPGSLAEQPRVRAVANIGNVVPTDAVAWADPGPTRIAIVVDAEPGPELLVRFVDRDGAPAEVKGRLSWSRIQEVQHGTLFGPAGECAIAGHETRIKGLLDGDHLRLRLQEDDRLESGLEVTLPAGASAQEAVLQRGLSKPRAEIPLVDRDGRPVVAGDYVVTVVAIGAFGELAHELQPDSAGVLAVALDETAGGQLEVAVKRKPGRFHWPVIERMERPYNSTDGEPPPPDPPLAILPIAPCGPGQVLRLPPVVVPEVAPRIVGSVVDASGAPVSGVRIWMTTVTAPEPKAFAEFATTTDAAGRFAIHATALPDEVFVLGRMPLGFCPPVRVRPSPVPVTLHLQPTGAIAVDARATEHQGVPEALARQLWPRVKLYIDDAGLADGYWALFRHQTAYFDIGWQHRWSAGLALPEHGELLFRDLVPNVYGIQVTFGLNVDLDLAGVRVEAGTTVRPPQLQGVTLGTGVEPGRVHVHDAAGAVANARVGVQLPAWKARGAQPQWVGTDSNGDAWFVVPLGAVAEVSVTAAGHAPMQLAVVGFPLDVAIGVGTSLDVAVRGHEEVAPDVRALIVACEQYDREPPATPLRMLGGTESLPYPLATLDSGGRCTIPNLTPGTWRLWLAALPPIDSHRSRTFVLLEDRVITARDPAHVVIEHRLGGDEVRTLLGR